MLPGLCPGRVECLEKPLNSLKSDFSFSPVLAFYRVMRKISSMLSFTEIALFWNSRIEKYIYGYISRVIRPCLDKYRSRHDIGVKQGKDVIWTCWWQGVDRAPRMIQNCVESMRMHAGGREVIVITKDNWSEYIDIPDFIMRRVWIGGLDLIKLSDYIRVCLLEKYGGLWLDSTIFCAKDIPDDVFSYPWYTAKNRINTKLHVIERSEWVFNQCGGWSGNFVFSYLRESLETYWRVTNMNIDYYLIDYIFRIGLDNIPQMRYLQDVVPYNCQNRDSLNHAMKSAKPFSEWSRLTGGSTFAYKLDRKGSYKARSHGRETVYAFFMRRGYLTGKGFGNAM